MIRPKKLSAITLTVRDLERSLAWYRDRFGFETLYADAPNSSGVVVAANGVELLLKQVENPGTAEPIDHRGQICVQLFGFEVDEADFDRVEQEFSEDDHIIALDDHPKYRSRIIEDPDGHAIELTVEK